MKFSAKIMPMIDLFFKNYTSQKFPKEKFFREVLNTGIKELKLKNKKIEIGLSLVGEAKIKELNKKYRGKNEVTDVLSFPLEESRLKKHGILPLGDIFICLPFAVKESKRQKISLKKELAWLTVHGFLHLFGYDHEKSKTAAKNMLSIESRILAKIPVLKKIT